MRSSQSERMKLVREASVCVMSSIKTVNPVGVAYLMFAVSLVVVVMGLSDLDLSSLLTLSLGLQCLSFALLAALVDTRQSMAGISGKMLQLYFGVSVCRLCSTLFCQGYVPYDATGDFVYQLSDATSAFIILGLLVGTKVRHARTFEAEKDTFNITPAVVACFVGAALVHCDLNLSPFFDTMWQLSLNLDSVAMIPQLWLLTKVGGKVPKLMGHFIATMVISRACSCLFWVMAYPELAPLNGGMNICGLFVVFPQLAMLLIAADFMYLYVKSAVTQEDLVLPTLQV